MRLSKLLYRNILLFIFTCSCYDVYAIAPLCENFITIKGRDFHCGESKFYPFVCNFYFSLMHNGTWNSHATPPVTDYFLSPLTEYGSSPLVECQDNITCFQELKGHFKNVHDLGFNSIRTAGVSPSFNVYNHTDVGFGELNLSLTPNDFAIWASLYNPAGAWQGYTLTFSPDINVVDDKRELVFQMYRSILQAAYEETLKVFLDVQYRNVIDPIHFDGTKKWLESLATFIHSLPLELRQTLVAYVLIEEPQYTSVGLGYDKHTICERTSEMYDLVKSIDNEHLITIGGGEPQSLLNWDSGIMKYDFVCPHFYPFFRYISSTSSFVELNSDFAVERILGSLYWLKNYCPYPYMIGETGFTALDDVPGGVKTFPEVNGLVDFPSSGVIYSQKNFMHDVIKMTRDCGGSGFSVWHYQERCLNHDGYGILRIGNPLTNLSSLKKPVCEEFESYLDGNTGLPPPRDPNGGQRPAFYYDPYHYGVTGTGIVDGYIQDEITGEKIKGAYIEVIIPIDLGVTTTYKENYTYSHDESSLEGYFSLLPWDFYNEQVVLPPFPALRISAVGASRLNYGNPDIGFVSDPATTQIGNTYLLKRNTLNNNNIVHDEIITASQNVNYNGFSSLFVHNFTTEDMSIADLKGQFEVNLSTLSTLKRGSEVLLHTGQVFPECTEFSSYLRLGNPRVNENNNDNLNSSTISIQFKTKKENVIIFPNPTSGKFNIQSTLGEKQSFNISISNSLGKQVYSKNEIEDTGEIIDISNLPKGVYFVLIKSNLINQVKKLILE